MKLGTLKSSHRDGQLCVVSKDNTKLAVASHIAPNLREAVENWPETQPALTSLYQQLNEGKAPSQPLKPDRFLSPLPRTFQWIDGSTFIQHIKLVRKSRQAPLPETLETIPLVYQGAGDSFFSPRRGHSSKRPCGWPGF